MSKKGMEGNYVQLPLRNALCEAIAYEIDSMTGEEDFQQVAVFIQQLESSGLYMFFTTECLEMIVTSVTNHLAIRRFVFGVSERMDMTMAAVQTVELFKDIPDDWATHYRSKLYLARQGVKASVLPHDVAATLSIPEETLRELLVQDRWILVLYLSIATGAYQTVLDDIANLSTKGS